MNKNILLLVLIVLNFLKSSAQENNNEFWEALFNNDRDLAEKLLTTKNSNTTEYLITSEIIREEKGNFTTHKDFTEAFLKQSDFEYYLYALWNESFLFDTYLETGFNKRNKDVLKSVSKKTIKNQDVLDAIKYLQSIVSRQNKDWDSYFDLNKSMQTINNWQYCGVFENLNESGLDKFFEPEVIAQSQTPFDAKSNGFVNWYESKNTREAYQFFTNHDIYGSGVNYAQTFISSSTDQDVIVRIGSGSAFKLWLNDVLIYENPEDVTTELNAYKIKVTIPKGENRLLIKCAESDYVSYFIAGILNADETPNTSLKYSSKFKTYNKSTIEQIKPEVIENKFEAFFKNKIKENPNNFFYHYCLTYTYLRNSKYAQAKDVLKPFIEKYPKSSFLRKLLIMAYIQEEDDTSHNELKKNMELDDPDYYLPLVYKISESNDLKRMTIPELKIFLDKFEATIKHESFSILIDFVYSARIQDMKALRQNLDKFIEISKDNVSMLLQFAPLYDQLFKEDDKTIDLLEDLNDNYFNYSAVKTLSGYYAAKKEKTKSLKIISKDLEHLSSDNTYLSSIIRKMHTYQKYKESLTYINKGLENFPYSFTFLEQKGDALVKLEDKKNALLAYEASLKHNSASSSLRKKIKDLKDEPNVLNDITLKEAYNYIELNRGKIKTNNYGYNILNDDSNIELYKEGGGKYRNVYLYEITSNSGIEFFKEYNLGLYGNYHIEKSEIVKQDGSIIPADKSGSNLVFNGLEIGDVIYLDYEGSFSSSGRFYKDYTDNFIFDSYHPTVKSTLKLLTPKEHKLFYKVVNGELEPKMSTIDNYDLYTWEINNSEGIPQYEDYMPETVDIARYLHISTIKNWNEISIWYSDLVRSSIKVDSSVKEVFNTLFPNGYKHLNEEEKAKIIYNYIKNNFTYSYVSFRQSGYVPQKPSKTIKTNLGDCKDFSTLFVTLANMAELESNLVLILTADHGDNSLVLPSTDFNHCIAKVKIDGKNQFLELTDKYLPFKSLPISLRGATGLEIPFNSNTDAKYDLMKLDHVTRDASIYSNNVKVTINDGINITTNTKITGHVNSFYAGVLDEPNPEVVKKSIYEDLSAQIKEDFTLDELTDIERIDNDRVIKFNSKLTVDKKINKIGSINILQLPIVSYPYTSAIISLDKREYPIKYFNYENIDEYINTYNVFIDSGKSFVEIPKNKKFSFKKHSYEISYSKIKDNHLQVKMHAKTSGEDITTADYEAFKVYVKSILDAEKEFIGFK